jgi:hypothetical protein
VAVVESFASQNLMNEATEPSQPLSDDEVPEVPKRALDTYARLWQLKTWLRRMIYVELRALLGDAWSQNLPKTGSFDADKRLTHMPTPEMNALSYAQLSELTQLMGTHWMCLKGYLPPQDLWDAKLKEINQIRHRVAHFRRGHTDDQTRLLQFLRISIPAFGHSARATTMAGPCFLKALIRSPRISFLSIRSRWLRLERRNGRVWDLSISPLWWA